MSQSRNTTAHFGKIRLSKQPSHPNDVATKTYVDNNSDGGLVKIATRTEISATTGTLIPPSAMLSGYINRTCTEDSGLLQDKLPSASSLISAISGATIGSYFDFMYVCNYSYGMEFDQSTSDTDGYIFRGDGNIDNEEMRIFRVLITDIDTGFYHIFQYDN